MAVRDGEPDRVGGEPPKGVLPEGRFGLEQLIILGFEAWWSNPQKVAEERFDPGIVCVNHCPKHLTAFGGSHIGIEPMVQSFIRFQSEFVMSQPNVTSILTDGFHIAVGWSLLMRHIGTGRSGRVNGMAHITMGPDLLIRRVENFFDTAAVAEVGEMLQDFAAKIEALDLARRKTFRRSVDPEES